MADLFKVSCTYCQEDINGLRIQCCVCPDFDICLQCFAAGAEIGPHKNDHSYKFVDQCDGSIFGGRGNWTGREELQLLDAVELYGFGNWDLVSQHVETKTNEEAKEEYIARYLDGNIGKAVWAELANHKPILTDDVPDDKGPLAPSVTSRLPPLNASPEEARLLGYKSHRDDYEREFDMPAEQLVSSLQLDTSEDTNLEIALKLAIVDMYIRRLRERARRKRIVRDYQLVSKFFANQRKEPPKRPLTKEHRELRDNMRVFSQFLTSGEHERLIASIERERELRHRLSELFRYRSLGMTTQEEIIHYEQHEAFHRQQQLRQNKSGSSGLPVQEPSSKNGRSEGDPSSTEGRSTSLLLDAESESTKCNCNCNTTSNNWDDPVPVGALPCKALLSQHELKLCTKLNLHPVQYLTMKSVMIQENLTSPKKKRKGELLSDDCNVEDVVSYFLSVSGWLPEY